MSLFHWNIASLLKNKDELETIFKFGVISITETKIKTKNPGIDTDIIEYKCYSTPTEAVKGGSIIYIDEHYITIVNQRTLVWKRWQISNEYSIILL